MAVTEEAVVWQGAEALRPHLVPIGSVTPHPRNPRQGDVEAIKLSLKRFGQVRPILLDADRVIVAKNHTWRAAGELGWTHVAAVVHEFTSPEEARDYLLADNRLADLGDYDRDELLEMLAELEETQRWEGTGYEARHLEQLRALEAAAAAPPPEPPAPTPAPTPPPAMREVVLLLNDEQFEGFGRQVRQLRRVYGLEGVTETVMRALREDAQRLNQAGAPDG